jgi:putative Mg2+ transporter-C (MgtC) family protein
MNSLTLASLASYWSAAEMQTNLVICLNLLGAMLLGMVVGYERSYHGRAAGMRTYGLVCMASAALTVIAGYPGFWYGGQSALATGADPTRIIQGIVTGVGFLGAGVIMREGFNISGLTTAASIWGSSAIGIMVGVGFYAAAIALALLFAATMLWMSRLEGWLPSRPAIAVFLRFKKDFVPNEQALQKAARSQGYELAEGTLAISFRNEQPEWRFVAIAISKRQGVGIAALANELSKFEGAEDFELSHARN